MGRIFFITAGIFLLPIGLALFPWANFYWDWWNTLWQGSYFGEYLYNHGAFPEVFNTQELIGMAFPMFYGHFLYPVLGALGIVVNIRIALSLVILGVSLLQFLFLLRVLRKYGATPWQTLGISALIGWAVYPMTNLYNRGALPEFIAFAILNVAVCCWFLFLAAQKADERRNSIWLGTFFLTLAAGTHLITAVLGGVAFLLIAVLTYGWSDRDKQERREDLWIFTLAAACGLLVLSPLFYSGVRYHGLLHIHALLETGPYFSSQIDGLSARLALFPIAGEGPGITTPGLDAPTNLPLLCFVLFSIGALVKTSRWEKVPRRVVWVIVGSLLVYVALLLWSIDPFGLSLAPQVLLRLCQYPYRLVSYQNLFLMISCFALLKGGTVSESTVLRFCVVYALICVGVKYAHVEKTLTFNPFESNQMEPSLPRSFYSFLDYGYPALDAPQLLRERSQNRGVAISETLEIRGEEAERILKEGPIRLPVASATHFGEVGSLVLKNSGSSSRFLTNVQASPWNHLLVDGREISLEELRMVQGRFVVEIPSGSHRVSYRHASDSVWVFLRALSFWGIGAWGLALVFVWLRRRSRSSFLISFARSF